MPRRPRLNSKQAPRAASKKAPELEPTTEKEPQGVTTPVEVADVTDPEPRARVLELRMLKVLVVALALHATYAFSVGFGHNISDVMGFRQTQTALATSWLLDGSPWFAYHLPLFGPPYGLPLEFPLYQWVTALLVAISGMPLILAGRIVSIMFFLTCAVALWKLLDFFHAEIRCKLIIVALLLVCPIYLFWSRTFMIETCALSVCLWFTLFALRAAADRRRKNLAIATMLGALAGIVKVTTLVPFWVALAGWLAMRFWKRLAGLRTSVLLASLLLVVPLVAGMAWVRFADVVIARNEIAASFLLSSKLHTWVFGTLADRVRPELWDTMSTRMLPEILGTTASFFCILVLLPLARRYSRHAAICAALFFVSILVLPNLNRFHPYYQAANALFLIAAAGFLIYGLMQGSESHRIGGYAFFVVLIVSCLYRYYNSYFPAQQKEFTGLMLAGEEVQRHAKRDQLIIVKGYDWNSEIPFYSHRRAIMDRLLTKEQIQRRIRAAAPATVGDILYCFDARKQHEGLDLNGRIARVQQEYGLAVTSASDDGLCIHYFKAGTVINTSNLPCIGTMDAPRENESAKGSILVAGWVLSGQPIKKIAISIDDQEVASSGLTVSRPDVVKAYPQYPGDAFSGYSLHVDISRFGSGIHTLRTSAILQDGSVHEVRKKTFVVIP